MSKNPRIFGARSLAVTQPMTRAAGEPVSASNSYPDANSMSYWPFINACVAFGSIYLYIKSLVLSPVCIFHYIQNSLNPRV